MGLIRSARNSIEDFNVSTIRVDGIKSSSYSLQVISINKLLFLGLNEIYKPAKLIIDTVESNQNHSIEANMKAIELIDTFNSKKIDIVPFKYSIESIENLMEYLYEVDADDFDKIGKAHNMILRCKEDSGRGRFRLQASKTIIGHLLQELTISNNKYLL
jgi:hypothetical protein